MSGDDKIKFMDWVGLRTFLTAADSNGEIDNPEEAAAHTGSIKRALLDDPAHKEWVDRFGKENLRAWGLQFERLSKPEKFELYRRERADVMELEAYLAGRHFYRNPTRFEGVEGVAPDQTRYFLQDPVVEEAMFVLCKSAGGAKNAIQFIERMLERYPNEFQTCLWEHFCGNFSKVKPFDGRKAHSFAKSLKGIAAMIDAEKKGWLGFSAVYRQNRWYRKKRLLF